MKPLYFFSFEATVSIQNYPFRRRGSPLFNHKILSLQPKYEELITVKSRLLMMRPKEPHMHAYSLKGKFQPVIVKRL